MSTTPVLAEALDERLLASTTAALDLASLYLGDRLGFYRVLADGDARTVGELAAAAGTDVRYTREWLEHQAVTGFVRTDDDHRPWDERRFTLPAEHVGVLADPLSADHLAPFARMLVGIAATLDEVVDAFHTGRGVPFHRYGTDMRRGQGAINRPAFTHDLVDSWLAAAPDLHARLRSGGRIADLGCGVGWSTIALKAGYPSATVIGFDEDEASIVEARQHADHHDVHVRFEATDAAALADHGPFDAVLVLEALHDMARPADVLRAARRALTSDGSVVVADEKVSPTFTSPGDDVERMMYGWSVTHCLPASRFDAPSAAIGTVIREDTVRELAAEAGFGHVEVLPVDAGFFAIYRLRA
ncbi:class I SAM-dependent methyltransferase [Actinomarinicola tropica]|uniref:Methyltransferase domain-containing protein n=1 Tax=Actinomarinicola tropica TaxID=2789776 RepID=A0A5Q2RTJ1_9ACTN|nr:class I SAM-dependent methyltransferase [Actinomarinicola tropica]QGG96535.1 methyltransferase domain-containing protein [Actinomarinicola tropica]